jgi:hypothetical protein
MVDSLFLRARTSEGNKLWTKCKEAAPVNIFKLFKEFNTENGFSGWFGDPVADDFKPIDSYTDVRHFRIDESFFFTDEVVKKEGSEVLAISSHPFKIIGCITEYRKSVEGEWGHTFSHNVKLERQEKDKDGIYRTVETIIKEE